MIDARGLAKRYGDVEALAGIDVQVDRGETVGLLGPNGAGKTTALRILTTFLAPDRGTATIDGFDVVRSADAVRRRIGYLPERPPLYDDHTVREYLSFCARLRGLGRAQRRAAVDTVVERCNLGSVRDRLIANLSKGFRQRVGLAQAWVHDPAVLILDEPTSGLDPNQVRELRGLIAELATDRAVLLSTHVLSEVARTCDRAVVLHRGRVVADDTLAGFERDGGLDTAFARLTLGDER